MSITWHDLSNATDIQHALAKYLLYFECCVLTSAPVEHDPFSCSLFSVFGDNNKSLCCRKPDLYIQLSQTQRPWKHSLKTQTKKHLELPRLLRDAYKEVPPKQDCCEGLATAELIKQSLTVMQFYCLFWKGAATIKSPRRKTFVNTFVSS